MVETDDERALTRMRAALAMLETQSVPIELAEARLSCARTLAHRGRKAEARNLLEQLRASVQGTEARTLVTVAEEMGGRLGRPPSPRLPRSRRFRPRRSCR